MNDSAATGRRGRSRKMTIEFANGKKITAAKNVLNMIAIYASEAREKYEKSGYSALASEAEDFEMSIYNRLKEDGFYD